MLQRGITLLTVIIGNAMYAAVAVLFLLPSGLPTGGTTGIALLVNRLTGLSVSMFVLGFNIVMLVVGFIFLGKKFAFTTIVSTFTYPICLELFGQIFANVHFTDDIWLNTIFSGLGIGGLPLKTLQHFYVKIQQLYLKKSVLTGFQIGITRVLFITQRTFVFIVTIAKRPTPVEKSFSVALNVPHVQPVIRPARTLRKNDVNDWTKRHMFAMAARKR